MKDASDSLKFARAVAKHRGWYLNEDDQLLDVIFRGLATNFRRFGYFQCPCRDSWGEREKDRDIICPCSYAEEDIAEYGQCYCGLFVNRGFLDAGVEANAIPERRPDDRYP